MRARASLIFTGGRLTDKPGRVRLPPRLVDLVQQLPGRLPHLALEPGRRLLVPRGRLPGVGVYLPEARGDDPAGRALDDLEPHGLLGLAHHPPVVLDQLREVLLRRAAEHQEPDRRVEG